MPQCSHFYDKSKHKNSFLLRRPYRASLPYALLLLQLLNCLHCQISNDFFDSLKTCPSIMRLPPTPVLVPASLGISTFCLAVKLKPLCNTLEVKWKVHNKMLKTQLKWEPYRTLYDLIAEETLLHLEFDEQDLYYIAQRPCKQQWTYYTPSGSALSHETTIPGISALGIEIIHVEYLSNNHIQTWRKDCYADIATQQKSYAPSNYSLCLDVLIFHTVHRRYKLFLEYK
ncbi:uncharacterized protein G2W53_022012 [Senna tora]|uniref:Uncharacterized protein n=1 Tax=Senna tora TaxID=362788 RepID=A0A834TKJ7_9FABA|nr:uncharacterized protein G2W53_022012 [Senna tora]